MHSARRTSVSLIAWAVLATALLCASQPASVRAQAGATASYQAANWDKEITLPPNAYRAPKPIAVNGDFTVKTQPGTLVEGVSFEGHSGRQHYHAEGTLFRRCRFGVKMNGSGHFIDSALEDCNFNKDDNWFMQWWSTHWQFDNCVFSKQFVRGDLPPLDYSVHATRCTFYAVRLPPVGFKEDPSKYMQKGDMGFEKCRFVDCDVPQSFLACTVDCVFESCRFEPKNKLVWPKDTGSFITVRAYYAEGGSEPSSFHNGPLTVNFEKAPRDGEFGSTVPHTQSGGRITLTNLKLGGQFAQLGIVPKKASEIVDVPTVAEAATPAPGTTTAVALIPTPAPVIAAGEVHGVEELFRALPSGVEVVAHGQPNPAGIEAANAFLAKNYTGRPASLRLMLAGTHALGNDGSYQADGAWQGTLYHGTTVPACAVATFRAPNAAALAKVPLKSEFPLRGMVSKAAFNVQGNAVSFVLSVSEAQALDNLAAFATPGPGAGAPAASGEAQMVGTWTLLVISSGFHDEMTFGTDHSMIFQGRRQGSWAIKANQCVISFDDKSHEDLYDLPAQEGVLYGKNTTGDSLQMSRQGAPASPALEALVPGAWDFDNHDGDGWHRSYRFNADHTFMEGNELRGHWFLLGHVLMFRWEGHPEWTDHFTLPGKDGVLTGVNGFHHPLTLTRNGTTAPPKPVVGTKPGTTYFGTSAGPRVP